jgi:membrane-associated phospholipid phosphatase
LTSSGRRVPTGRGRTRDGDHALPHRPLRVGPAELPDCARLGVLPQPRHWVLVSVALTVAVLALGYIVTGIHQITSTEVLVDEELSRDHAPALTALALIVNGVFSPLGNVIILVVIFLFLLVVRRAPVNATAVTLLIASGWLSAEAFKLLVARPRLHSTLLAHPLLAEPGADSFPSGHTSFAVAAAIGAYVLARGTRWRMTATLAGVAFVLLVGATRLYLGVHYPSDIVGAVLGPLAAMGVFVGIWNKYGLKVLGRIRYLHRFGPIPVRE